MIGDLKNKYLPDAENLIQEDKNRGYLYEELQALMNANGNVTLINK